MRTRLSVQLRTCGPEVPSATCRRWRANRLAVVSIGAMPDGLDPSAAHSARPAECPTLSRPLITPAKSTVNVSLVLQRSKGFDRTTTDAYREGHAGVKNARRDAKRAVRNSAAGAPNALGDRISSCTACGRPSGTNAAQASTLRWNVALGKASMCGQRCMSATASFEAASLSAEGNADAITSQSAANRGPTWSAGTFHAAGCRPSCARASGRPPGSSAAQASTLARAAAGPVLSSALLPAQHLVHYTAALPAARISAVPLLAAPPQLCTVCVAAALLSVMTAGEATALLGKRLHCDCTATLVSAC